MTERAKFEAWLSKAKDDHEDITLWAAWQACLADIDSHILFHIDGETGPT